MKDIKQTPSNLILVGFMGTGKSTIGKFSAKSLGFTFVDTDDLIVKIAGKSIPEIFSDDGEAYFRELEMEALRRCATQEHLVIATGGGIIMQEKNRELLRKTGHVIWLKAKAEAIYDRVRWNHNRPLLETEDPLATIRELLEKRNPFYQETADDEVETTDLTVDEIVFGVTETARIAFSTIS